MPGRNATSLLWGQMPLDSIVTSPFNTSAALAKAVQQRPGVEEDGSAAEPETLSSCWHLMDASNAVYLYAFPLLLMLGVLFNSVNFVLFRSSIGLRLYSFTVFICTVSVTDSLALVTQAPRRWLGLLYQALHWHHSLLQPTTSYDTSDAACKALSYAAELTQFVSLWTVVLLAWERTIVAQNPYRQSRFRQTRTACHAVAFVVISGLVLKSHVIVSWHTTTHPLGAMTTMTSGNVTKSPLMSVTTSKQEADTATTKRPTRNLPNRRCTPHNQENWMKQEECGKENGKKIINRQHSSQEDEREAEYRKLQIDFTSLTRRQHKLRPPISFGVTAQTDTRRVNTRLSSSAYDHHDHRNELAVETSNGSKASAAVDQNQPNDNRDFLPNEDREASTAAVHRMVSKTTFDPRDAATSSTPAIDARNTSRQSRPLRRSKGASETDTTHNQRKMNATGQNETEPDIRTDVESSHWNLFQQINATPSFIKEGNTLQGFRDSTVSTEQENLADNFGNVSTPDLETPISLGRPDAVANGSSPTSLLQDFSSYSANDPTSFDGRPLNPGTKESTPQHKQAPNWTTQPSRRSRLKKRDLVPEHEMQPKAKPCSRPASGQCQFIQTANATQTTTAIWMVSLVVEALTKVVPAVVLSGLLVSSLSGLHSWNIDQTRLSTDLTCRLLMERHVTIMAVCIIASQVILCLPMSVVWLLDLYFRLVTGLSTCQEAQMVAASVLTELVFMVNFAVKFLLCFTSGRQILSI